MTGSGLCGFYRELNRNSPVAVLPIQTDFSGNRHGLRIGQTITVVAGVAVTLVMQSLHYRFPPAWTIENAVRFSAVAQRSVEVTVLADRAKRRLPGVQVVARASAPPHHQLQRAELPNRLDWLAFAAAKSKAFGCQTAKSGHDKRVIVLINVVLSGHIATRSSAPFEQYSRKMQESVLLF